MTEAVHEELGGSWSDIWSACTGAYFLKKQMPPKTVSPAMELGTRVHAVGLEYYLKGFLQHKIEGSPWPLPPHSDKEVIEQSLLIVDVIWNHVFHESVTDKAYGIEDKFFLSKSLSMGGFADLWIVEIDDKGKKCLTLLDYKNGQTPVSIEANQFPFYICCIMEELKAHGKSIDYAWAYCYQPHTRIPNDDPTLPHGLKKIKYTAKQLEAFREKFFKAANDIMVHKKSTFKAGEHCRWCDAQGICATYKKQLSKTTSLKLLDDNPFDDVPAPESLTDEQLAGIIKQADRIRKFLESCEDYCKDRNLNKSPVAGTKCVYGRTQRKWKKEIEDSFIEKMGKDFQVPVSELVNIKLKGIGETEEILGKFMKKKDTKLFLDAYTEQSYPSIKLVVDTDPGEALQSGQSLLNMSEVKLDENQD